MQHLGKRTRTQEQGVDLDFEELAYFETIQAEIHENVLPLDAKISENDMAVLINQSGDFPEAQEKVYIRWATWLEKAVEKFRQQMGRVVHKRRDLNIYKRLVFSIIHDVGETGSFLYKVEQLYKLGSIPKVQDNFRMKMLLQRYFVFSPDKRDRASMLAAIGYLRSIWSTFQRYPTII